LRHSSSTLLLNAGVPVEALQELMGHKNIETTLQYTRLYDSTVATDYGNKYDCLGHGRDRRVF
jgi:site-specific recombinase XerD